MIYSYQKPTAPGWYWRRVTEYGGERHETIVRVDSDGATPVSGFWCRGTRGVNEYFKDHSSKWDSSMEWAGPIQNPQGQ